MVSTGEGDVEGEGDRLEKRMMGGGEKKKEKDRSRGFDGRDLMSGSVGGR